MRKSPTPDRRLLVLISGPIASGKTTAARTLADLARRQGYRAASIDMDEAVAIVAGEDWSRVRGEDRVLATRIASTMVAELFDAGMEIVTVAGSTLANHEWEDLIEPLKPRPKPLYVLLRVSDEEAVRRTQNDPTRSRDDYAAFIARMASRIDWGAIRDHHVDLPTDGLDAAEVGRILAEKVFAREGRE